jgi:hypothetical protein
VKCAALVKLSLSLSLSLPPPPPPPPPPSLSLSPLSLSSLSLALLLSCSCSLSLTLTKSYSRILVCECLGTKLNEAGQERKVWTHSATAVQRLSQRHAKGERTERSETASRLAEAASTSNVFPSSPTLPEPCSSWPCPAPRASRAQCCVYAVPLVVVGSAVAARREGG